MNMLKASNPENNVSIKTSAEKANSANYQAYILSGWYFSKAGGSLSRFHDSAKLRIDHDFTIR